MLGEVGGLANRSCAHMWWWWWWWAVKNKVRERVCNNAFIVALPVVSTTVFKFARLRCFLSCGFDTVAGAFSFHTVSRASIQTCVSG